MVDLYIHSPIRLHGVVLNLLSTGTTLLLRYHYRITSQQQHDHTDLTTRYNERQLFYKRIHNSLRTITLERTTCLRINVYPYTVNLILIIFNISFNLTFNWAHNDSPSLSPFAFQVIHNPECHVRSALLYTI
jgi:hypothetical protein